MAQAFGGAFIPTTNVWDVTEIQNLDLDPGLRELLVRLYQNLNRMSLLINLKDTGYYVTFETINSQMWTPAGPVATNNYIPDFRIVVNFGTLPNTATKSVAHGLQGISGTWSFTRIYATASDPIGLTYIPIPYASPVLANNIELNVDATNVNITTGSDRTNYTICYVVLEYLKF
jgi:hypothetical protein